VDKLLSSLLNELEKIDMQAMLDELNIDTEELAKQLNLIDITELELPDTGELIKDLNINMDKMLQELQGLQDI
jgi:hypothetical protein